MKKEKASELAKDLSETAYNIFLQLKEFDINPTSVETFYLALLTRSVIILSDLSIILDSNSKQPSTSSYILCRVLLDDFIRLLSVDLSNNPEEEIIKIQAEALDHRLKTAEFSAKFNEKYFESKHKQLSTKELVTDERQRLLANPNYDVYFSSKVGKGKFKKSENIAILCEALINDKSNLTQVERSYALYKELTRHVHYSHITYPFPSVEAEQQAETQIFEEFFLYCYRMIQVHFNFFSKKYSLIWSDTKLQSYFNSKGFELK